MDKRFESLPTQQSDSRLNVINELGIFELRSLAREMGVPSPTTRKRGELVDLIVEKLSNGVPNSRQTRNKKGRPCKNLNNLDKIISAVTGGEDLATIPSVTKRIRPYDEVVTFAQDLPVFSMLMEEEIGEFEGVLRLAEKVGYFIDIKTGNKIFISLEIVEKHELKSGDLIKVSASKLNTSNQYITNDILSVNFVDIKDYMPKSVLPKQPTILFKTLPFGEHKIYRGRRNVIRYQKHVFEDIRFVNFVKTLIADSFRVVILGLNVGFEDSVMLTNLSGAICFKTNYGEEYHTGLEKTVDAISLVNRLTEKGEKVALLVLDIVEVVNILDLCFDDKNKILGHNAEAVVIAQRLVSLAKAFEDGSEATLVMTYRDFNDQDAFLINEVLKVSFSLEEEKEDR